MSRRIGFLASSAVVLLTAGVARAQSEPTCTFDPAAGHVTVTVDDIEARLEAVASSGEIWLNGAPCAGATVFNTDTIQVSEIGSLSVSQVELRGQFVPGRTPEPTGGSEIEISFSLSSFDYVDVKLSPGRDVLVLASDGIDVGNDGDRDISTLGVGLRVYGLGGNDRIDASAYVGTSNGPALELHGGRGNDVLVGSSARGSWLFGDDDDDVLTGGDGNDTLHGGMGDDRMVGNGGVDRFWQGVAADGADDMRGGDGFDEVAYSGRTNGVTVTIGDAEPDGEPGEGDLVRGDVEKLRGGNGPDVLVGNGLPNTLVGEFGDDQLYGGGGDDYLTDRTGQTNPGLDPGNDILVGDGGNDILHGGGGDDFLDGGLGTDLLEGYVGADILHGGPGPDTLDGGDGQDEFFGDGGNDSFLNRDGFAETVDCGAGTGDDAEPSALDTFISCEQI